MLDATARDYFRGDQADGISPPDLSKSVGYVDHIVKARGKRTQFTSVSRDAARIRDFGEQLYRLRREEARCDGHELIEHETLTNELRRVLQSATRAERQKASWRCTTPSGGERGSSAGTSTSAVSRRGTS